MKKQEFLPPELLVKRLQPKDILTVSSEENPNKRPDTEMQEIEDWD